MDKNLQKLLLEIIKEENGIVEWDSLAGKAKLRYWQGHTPQEANVILKHNLNLLAESKKIEEIEDDLFGIFYSLKSFGYGEFSPLWKKISFFILYDKNNLFVILALIISILALIISIFR